MQRAVSSEHNCLSLIHSEKIGTRTEIYSEKREAIGRNLVMKFEQDIRVPDSKELSF